MLKEEQHLCDLLTNALFTHFLNTFYFWNYSDKCLTAKLSLGIMFDT